ncbi:MAG: hypothetical protein DRP85_03810 [Candidatus Makaraimicrobium thalassicum]|nr:MAG: hypothetical protein DRP85_03810 [Candidatus Omnitrophota bacterium]
MRNERFIVTRELGKLAKWLRILGYDSIYYEKKQISGLIIQALREKRILLTRSPVLAKYTGIRVIIVRHDHVEDQIEQVTKEMPLPLKDEDLFQRCVECNTPLEDIAKEEAGAKVPEYVFRTQEVFKRCPQCGKIFWKGTHWDMVEKALDKVRGKGRR